MAVSTSSQSNRTGKRFLIVAVPVTALLVLMAVSIAKPQGGARVDLITAASGTDTASVPAALLDAIEPYDQWAKKRAQEFAVEEAKQKLAQELAWRQATAVSRPQEVRTGRLEASTRIAQAGSYEQVCGYETIGEASNGGGRYYICRSTMKTSSGTHEHACAFAGGRTWCQGGDTQGARVVKVPKAVAGR